MKKLLTLSLMLASLAMLAGCTKTETVEDEAVAPVVEEVAAPVVEETPVVEVATGTEATVEMTGEVATGN